LDILYFTLSLANFLYYGRLNPTVAKVFFPFILSLAASKHGVGVARGCIVFVLFFLSCLVLAFQKDCFVETGGVITLELVFQAYYHCRLSPLSWTSRID
jgi:hypothetical protein